MTDEKPRGPDATDDEGAHPPHDEVGSVGEEAAKLLNALNDWAKEAGSGQAQAAASAAAGMAAGIRSLDEHIATGSAECQYCPVCQVISLVRNTSPEVKAHLGIAASSLLQAASGLLATHVPDEGERPTVEKIDLDDETAWDEGDWDE